MFILQTVVYVLATWDIFNQPSIYISPLVSPSMVILTFPGSSSMYGPCLNATKTIQQNGLLRPPGVLVSIACTSIKQNSMATGNLALKKKTADIHRYILLSFQLLNFLVLTAKCPLRTVNSRFPFSLFFRAEKDTCLFDSLFKC